MAMSLLFVPSSNSVCHRVISSSEALRCSTSGCRGNRWRLWELRAADFITEDDESKDTSASDAGRSYNHVIDHIWFYRIPER